MLVLYLSSENIDGMLLFDRIRPKIPSNVQLQYWGDTSLCRSSANLESLRSIETRSLLAAYVRPPGALIDTTLPGSSAATDIQ
jgi:hypothetical protein